MRSWLSKFKTIHAVSNLIQSFSILLIAIGLIYTHRQTDLLNRQLREISTANKRMYTFDILGDLSENGDLSDANFAMVQLINAKARIGVDSLNNPIILNAHELPDEIISKIMLTDENLVNLLNFYELIGTAYVNHTLDKALVLHVRGGPMSRAYDACEPYIISRRNSLGADSLYSNFAHLVRDFKSELGDK